MKKVLIFLGLVLLCLFVGSVSAMSGNGDADNPWIITTPADLTALSGTGLAGYGANAYYELGADIDMSGVANFEPIGTNNIAFIGHFDGKNHTITGLVITGESPIGLFVKLSGASISNINFVSSSITGTSYNGIGLLTGLCFGGTNNIDNVNVYKSSVIGDNHRVGGLFGFISQNNANVNIANCNIENCYIASTGGDSVGGIGGHAYWLGTTAIVSISNCQIKNCIVLADNSNGINVGFISGGGLLPATSSTSTDTLLKISGCDISNSYCSSQIGTVGGVCGVLTVRGVGKAEVLDCTVQDSTLRSINSNVGGIYGSLNSSVPYSISGCTISKCSIIGTSNVAGVGA